MGCPFIVDREQLLLLKQRQVAHLLVLWRGALLEFVEEVDRKVLTPLCRLERGREVHKHLSL